MHLVLMRTMQCQRRVADPCRPKAAVKLLAATCLALVALTGGCAVRQESAVAPSPAAPRDATPSEPRAQAAVPSANALPQDETQVGRYTTLAMQPAEADANPMAVIATVHFPREVVKTVGDAVRYVLIRTGYQLAAEDGLDARVKTVFGRRLPDNQRVLGPYRVDAMLGALMGQPYRLAADPASRTVTYVGPPAHPIEPTTEPPLGSAPAASTPAALSRLSSPSTTSAPSTGTATKVIDDPA
ncbi:MAG: hypothetical protein JF606_27980 [Burkholderiales bacterium]|jgi:conjugative transfer region protein (TIGR03748 family)|nr:hypothetical protein [Burkholderiales bacterium]